MLESKYNLTEGELYIRERRKAILSTDIYVGKTTNGINLVEERECHRGNDQAVYPICK